MHQYADKYTGSSSSGGGGNYQNYISMYADNYMGGGDNSSGGSSNQGYQKYMNQYADKYMHQGGGGNSTGASGQDYQQYMHQYADKYMGASSQNTTMLNSASSQGYQQYMQQYASKYMGGANQNTTQLNAMNSSGYQQYMHQYADKYMGGAGGAGGYQKYMSQYSGGKGGAQPTSMFSTYAGNYAAQYGNFTARQEMAKSVQQNPADCATWQCLCAWKHNQTAFLKATVPSSYSKYALENAETDYRKRLEAFATNSSTSVGKLGLSSECRPQEEGKAVPRRPEDCTTVSELKAWRDKQVDDLGKFVPAGVQQYAKQAAEKAYQDNLARLNGDDQTASASAPAHAAAAKQEAAPAPRKRWPFLLAEQPPSQGPMAGFLSLAAEKPQAAVEPSEPLVTEAAEAQIPAAAAVAPESRAEQQIYTEASGPSSGRVALFVLTGLSLPALVGLAGALASRRRNVAVAVEQDGLYEALVA
jgi:hypothetical protein